jgi:phage terminase large subunit
MKTSIIFQNTWESKEDVIVHQGGSSSGKTYSILQVLFAKAVSEPNLVITVVGQDIPNLKAGALRDAINIYNENEEIKDFTTSYNKSDRIFTFKNGSVMEFKSYSDAQDAKSGKRDYLFVNEANGIPMAVYNELAIRTKKQIYIDYNPNAEFWVHEHLIGKPNVKFFRSWHEHNPFLSDKIREKIEALKDVDEELWRVYARGMTGKIEGLVLRNWVLVDEIPKDAKHLGTGLDFGFTNDPTAIVEVFEQNGELWVRELMYQTGQTNQDIANSLKGYDKYIICDSAEPKSIEELRRSGLKVEPATKGKDSINISIDILRSKRLNITRDSIYLRKELGAYKYKVDKLTGKSLNEPIDSFNHLIDALRYVALNRLSKRVSAPKLTMSGYVR